MKKKKNRKERFRKIKKQIQLAKVEIPDELRNTNSYITAQLFNDANYYGFVYSTNIYFMLKVMSITANLDHILKYPIFDFQLSNREINQMLCEKNTLNDYSVDLYYSFKEYCEQIMYSLSSFNWKCVEELFFDTEEETLALDYYKNTHLKKYPECFDYYIDRQKQRFNFWVNVYTFRNEKLGKYLKFAERNKINEQLAMHISLTLKKIKASFDNCFSYIGPEYYELIYVNATSVDEEDISFLASTDFLLPYYAHQLDMFLNIAFEAYPIGEIYEKN